MGEGTGEEGVSDPTLNALSPTLSLAGEREQAGIAPQHCWSFEKGLFFR